MAKISLATYAVRIRERYARESLALDDVRGRDLLDMLRDYMGNRAAAYFLDEDEQKVLTVMQHARQGRYLNGLVETGEWGYRSELYDVDRRVVSYTRSPREAGLLPFYFLFHLPKGMDEGLLVLQRFQNLGVRTALSKDVRLFFEEHFGDYTIEIHPILAPEVWQAYLRDGRLLTIRFVRFHVPDDIAAAIDGAGHIEKIGKVEYVVTARRNSALPFAGRIKDLLEGRRHWDDFIELTDFEFDTVKVEVQFQGGTRTLELRDLGHVRAVYDVTDQVVVAPDGHPTFASIDQAAREYARDVQQGMGGGG